MITKYFFFERKKQTKKPYSYLNYNNKYKLCQHSLYLGLEYWLLWFCNGQPHQWLTCLHSHDTYIFTNLQTHIHTHTHMDAHTPWNCIRIQIEILAEIVGEPIFFFPFFLRFWFFLSFVELTSVNKFCAQCTLRQVIKVKRALS